MALWRHVQNKIGFTDGHDTKRSKKPKNQFSILLQILFSSLLIGGVWYSALFPISSRNEYAQEFGKIPLFCRIEQLCYQITRDAEASLCDENVRLKLFTTAPDAITPLVQLLEIALVLSEREREARIYLKEDLVYLKELVEYTSQLWQNATVDATQEEVRSIGKVLFDRILEYLDRIKHHNREYVAL